MSIFVTKRCNLTVNIIPVSVVEVGKRVSKQRSLSPITLNDFTQELHKVCSFVKEEANIQIQELWNNNVVIDYNDKFFYNNNIQNNVTFHGNRPSVAPTRTLYLASEIGYQLYKSIYLRRKLCQFLDSGNWSASYDDTNEYYHTLRDKIDESGKVTRKGPNLDINLYRNLMRCKTLPKMPQFTNKLDIRYGTSKLEHCSNLVAVPGTIDLYECEISLYSMRCIVRFKMPDYILLQLSSPNIKVTRVWLHYDTTQKNPFTWYTVLQYDTIIGIDIKDRILCYDLGIKKYCTMVIVNQNGRYSTEIQPSKEVLVLDGKIRRLIEERKYLRNKIYELNYQYNSVYKKRPYDSLLVKLLRKIDVLTSNSMFIGKKIMRLKKARAFILARDMRKICNKQHISTIVTENLRWVHNGGRWQQGLDNFCIEHICNKNIIHFKVVSAKKNSQTCPKCKSKVVHNNRTRTSKCKKCTYIQDRDYMASLMLSVKYYGKPIGNNQVLLSKYPNKIVKSSIIV